MKNNFSTQPKFSSRPILIVDKKGVIGELLASELSDHFIVVFVTSRAASPSSNLIHVPFVKKIPKIPDNFYSYIFLVDDAEILEKSMVSFVKKAKSDEGRIVLIEGIRRQSQKNIDETRFYKNANVFFYGDLFSSKQVLSTVGEEISEIKKQRKIKIKGEGLEKIYPIEVKDFIECLIEQVFIKNNSSKFVNIFPKAPVTPLSLSRIIQSIDPEISTDFQKTKEVRNDPALQEGDYPIDKYDLRSKLKEFLEEEVPSDFDKNDSLSEEITQKNYLQVAGVFLIIFILFFFFLPLFTTVFYSGLGLFEIDNLKRNLDKGDLGAAYKAASDSKTFFQFAQKTAVPLRSEARILGREGEVDHISSQLSLGKDVSESSMDLVSATQKIELIIKGEAVSPAADFNSAISLMKNAISKFRKIEAQKEDFPALSNKITDIGEAVDLASNLSNILPDALGFDKEKKYLILFQNNMELRPGGGFIGSYAIMTIKNSQVSDFKIHNVYDADGQLKGHIEPPLPIRKYFGQPNLFLRDSNFDLQFSNNASEAAFLLNLETGERVDGIAAVDVNFVKELLLAIGPVNVSDYNLTVNASNLFQITEEKAQDNSFPGSSQKQDFLSALLKSIQTKIGEDKNLPYLSLVKAVSSSLSHKHILLASNDPLVQDNLSVNNWSSKFPLEKDSQTETFNDFLGINEANFGANKVNYFISRSISKAQMIDDQGELSSTVTVNYRNDSQSDTYKNYLRFILPNSISVTQIAFDNVAQNIISPQKDPLIYESKNYKVPSGLEVDNYIQDGKTIVGFFINVPPKSSKTVSITYTLNQALSLGYKFNYNLYYFKQPGTTKTPFELSVYFPNKYILINSEKGSRVLGGRLIFNQTFDTDKNLRFTFSQK